jgi:hypothetical protein
MSSLTAPGARAGLAGDSPETRRSTLDPDRGYYGVSPARLRRSYGGTAALSAVVGRKLMQNEECVADDHAFGLS